MSEKRSVSGRCHCGTVKYEATVDLANVIECNCSHCSAKGFILTFVPAADFTLLTGKDSLTEYRFNKRQIAHLFCSKCGVQSFARGKGRDGSDMAAINVRCLDDVDIGALQPQKVDGRSF
jgi:hypothetical protein